MPIPLLDLKKQYAAIRDEAMRVTEEIYESQMFILGRRVEEFEKNFAAYCQTSHAVGVSSGTDALLIALMVLDLKGGDEVILPAYSFFATAGVVSRLGATPVFADIELESYNIATKEIERKITKKTKAIIPVHLFGQCADMDEINAIAREKKIAVIEDAAQAVGSELDGRRAGSMSLMGCFSFFPSKNLGAFGDAGAVTTNDGHLAERLIDFRVHGSRPKYYHRFVGGNFRIDALQAAILDVKLPHLDGWTEGRQRNAAAYDRLFAEKGLAERIALPKVLPRRRHIFNQYVIRFTEGKGTREKVMAALKEAQIGHDIYYPLTLPEQECFRDVPSAKDRYPESQIAADQSLAIPIFPELTEVQLEEVVETIANAMK